MFEELGIIVAVTLAVVMSLWIIKNRIQSYVGNRSIVKRFADLIFVPSVILALGLGIIYSIASLSSTFDFCINFAALDTAKRIFIVVMATWLLIRCKDIIVESIFHALSKKAIIHEDRTMILTVSRLITIVIFVFVGMTLLDILGVPISAILTFGGVGGLAVSWAAKDFIANFFGGIMIQINRHFAIGDWITSPNKHFEGIVEYIGWYMTRVRTFERRPMYIPNALMTDAIIENPGRMYNRRIKTNIGLRYKDIDKVKPISEEIEAHLKANPHVDQSQITYVRFVGFGASSLDIEVYCIMKPTKLIEFRNAQQDILYKIADIIAKHEAEVAFPTSTVHLEKG